ncbi:MAG: ABC-2 family transporter protein [Nanohaloarchaea archaeon]|nr:ABC-2 family transporter protein [Candidatus Nanohaloarchaea archaeon]
MYWGKYFQSLKIALKEAAAYKTVAFVNVINSLLTLVLYYAIWSAIASSGSIEGGLVQVMSYLAIGQAVGRATNLQTEMFLGNKIRDGSITDELKRPMSIRGYTYTHEAGWKIFESIVIAAPILVAGGLFFNVAVPSVSQLLLFLVSLFLAFNLVFSLAFITSVMVFWTKVGWSIRMMRNLAISLFSGKMFPLYLLPASIAPIFNILPFKGMTDTPVRIFMGSATGTEALKLMLHQITWTAILLIVGAFLWRKARKQLTVQGG